MEIAIGLNTFWYPYLLICLVNIILLLSIISIWIYKIYKGPSLVMFDSLIYDDYLIKTKSLLFDGIEVACPFDLEKIHIANITFLLDNHEKAYLKNITQIQLEKLSLTEQRRWFEAWTCYTHKLER